MVHSAPARPAPRSVLIAGRAVVTARRSSVKRNHADEVMAKVRANKLMTGSLRAGHHREHWGEPPGATPVLKVYPRVVAVPDCGFVSPEPAARPQPAALLERAGELNAVAALVAAADAGRGGL